MSTYSRPADLPEFEQPPVSEVVLSVQFASNPQFRVVHAGLFWGSIREQFPSVSEQVPLPPAFEAFGIPMMGQPVQIQALFAFPRFWFESDDKTYLLQLQQDRILFNWRATSGQSTYPRYEFLRARFVAEVERLAAFFKSEALGELRPNQCELTYINTITLGEGDDPHANLGRITPLWSDQGRKIDELVAERSIIQTHFILTRQGQPYGRLHVFFTPAFRADDFRPVIQLEMTARGRPAEETLEAAFRLLDHERCTIVRAFTDLTKEEIHNKWGRTDVAQS